MVIINQFGSFHLLILLILCPEETTASRPRSIDTLLLMKACQSHNLLDLIGVYMVIELL